MIHNFVSNYVNLKEGDLDDVFLMMKDMICRYKGIDKHIDKDNKIKIDIENHKLELELLDMCYECILNGVHPANCKMLIESRFLAVLNSQEVSNLKFMRVSTIISMIIVLYRYDLNGLYARASDLCSIEALNEIMFSCGEDFMNEPNYDASDWVSFDAVQK